MATEQFHYTDCIYSKISQHHGACACAERLAKHNQPNDDLRGEVKQRMESVTRRARGSSGTWHYIKPADAVKQAVALVQEKIAQERKARGHVQNCGCHRAPKAGDPCHAAMYGSDDHHTHPFRDLLCTPVDKCPTCSSDGPSPVKCRIADGTDLCTDTWHSAPPDKPGGERE